MTKAKTLGELKRQNYRVRSVKDELRAGGQIFPGIVGYDETVVPRLTKQYVRAPYLTHAL